MQKEETINEKKELLKEVFRKAKNEEQLEALRDQIKKVFKVLHPMEIAIAEQELLKEGLTWRDIYRMCDVHFDLVKDIIIPKKELRELPKGHPLSILLWENTEILKDAERLAILFKALKEDLEALKDIKGILSTLEIGLRKHYMKNQFLVFPYLEKRGVTAVPRVLWMKEDMLIARIKKLKDRISELEQNEEELKSNLGEILEDGNWIVNETRDIVTRENNILYPTMYYLMGEGEWLAVKMEMEKFGFYKDNPPDGEWEPEAKEPIYPYMLKPEDLKNSTINEKIPKETLKMLKSAKPDEYILVRENDIKLDNGYLTPEEINAIFNSMPFELTFIDIEKRTRFFNEPRGEKFFMRTRTILGRPVKLCHPPKSEELVKKVIEKLKEGEDHVDFWINFRGRLIMVRFFAVRNKENELMGVLEIVQDITDLKKIEGEKRTI